MRLQTVNWSDFKGKSITTVHEFLSDIKDALGDISVGFFAPIVWLLSDQESLGRLAVLERVVIHELIQIELGDLLGAQLILMQQAFELKIVIASFYFAWKIGLFLDKLTKKETECKIQRGL